jgi:WD40 repeat protein
VLASHLMEHRGAVNCLATSNNGALLLSGSDDETVKVRRQKEQLHMNVFFLQSDTLDSRGWRWMQLLAVFWGL